MYGGDALKITIEDALPGAEDEIIVRCSQLDDNLLQLINSLKQGNLKLNAYKDGQIFFLEPKDIYYFESVDQKVFAYGQEKVYETKNKLYELEELLPTNTFFRATKATILNLDMIKSLMPAFGGRFEALLKNGERMIISRQYVVDLKEKLGL